MPFAVFSNISSDDKHPLSERLIAEQLCKISEIEKWESKVLMKRPNETDFN